MNLDKQTYQKYAAARSRKSHLLWDCIKAFLVGGLICTIAELLFHAYLALSLTEENVKVLVPVTLIFIAALLTGIGWFDNIAKHAGAGTLVPITGFANAVVAPAIDTKADERDIIGLSRKAP